jgi:hypothetical protein
MHGCPDCFKEQGTINERYQNAIIDAKKLAKEENKQVAVYSDGQRFFIESFTGEPLPGYLTIADPVQ